jgi:hypothetical protein
MCNSNSSTSSSGSGGSNNNNNNWSLTLREEHRLRVFGNRMPRRISGPKRDEIIGGWRELHSEKLQKLRSSSDIIRMIKSRRMSRTCSTHGEKKNACRVLVGKPEEQRPLGRSIRRWEDNIKVHLREIGCGGMEWINVAQDRDQWRALVSTVINFRVP